MSVPSGGRCPRGMRANNAEAAQKGSSPSVVSKIHNQSQQGNWGNDKLILPVMIKILKQLLVGYGSKLATFLCEGFEQDSKGPKIPRFCSNLQSVR